VEKEVNDYAVRIGELVRAAAKEIQANVKILGPAPCPVTRLKANFRYHLQITASDLETLRAIWVLAAPQFPSHSTIEYQVDVEPQNFR
jgi:primosomal protein N' (replication factor Y)